VAAVAAASRLVRPGSSTRAHGDEVITCCGVMHITFLTCFYADFMSWTYYYYVMIIGLAGLAARGGRSAVLVLVIAAAALVGNKYQFSWIKHYWQTTRPVADMAGLWASEAEREEWHRIREFIGARRASVLATNGEGLTIIMPGFARAENMFILPGIPLPVDLRRKVDQVASAEVVLVRGDGAHPPILDLWPEFREALDGCELVYSGSDYRIYQRRRPPQRPATAHGSVHQADW
jgi:hypothetical protein